jgi:Ca-activated chloride channel family protein
MSLHWPWALLALLAFPLLLLVRWWLRRRRRRETVRVSSVTLIRAALPGPTSWRRRVPLILLATALAVLGVGAARPSAAVVVPSDASAILLAIDVSGSMCSSDVSPNRLTVAQDAARNFIDAQPSGTKIGLVTFAGTAALVVPPTADKQRLIDAIGTLRTYRGTAIGLGILQAIDAIAEINSEVAPTGVVLDPPVAGSTSYQPDTIVVLTDGANTQGVRPEVAAGQAAARGLRVYTIGFGTTQPATFVCTADQLGSGGFGGGFGGGGFGGGFGGGRDGGFDGGMRRALQLDEEALTAVAETTGGEYFKAEDAQQLNAVLRDLPSNIELQTRQTELTVWFALVGFLLAFAGIGLSFWWNRSPAPRPVAQP